MLVLLRYGGPLVHALLTINTVLKSTSGVLRVIRIAVGVASERRLNSSIHWDEACLVTVTVAAWTLHVEALDQLIKRIVPNFVVLHSQVLVSVVVDV